jgi:hypothetical protein
MDSHQMAGRVYQGAKKACTLAEIEEHDLTPDETET